MDRLYLTFLLVLMGFFQSFSQVTDRSVALQDYLTNFAASEYSIQELAWTGNTWDPLCNEGTISNSAKTKILKKINYFRRLVGVNDNIIFDDEKNEKCQEAALIMDVNNALNHQPPSNWQCWSQAGYEAAGSSNLSRIPIPYTSWISTYVRDTGNNNSPVGHRRWIFYSKAKIFGVGQTNQANALWVHQDNDHPETFNNFIAYPPNGFIPNKLVFPRWSFSIPNANFSNATVSVLDQNNNQIPTTIIHKSPTPEYGDRTIVWVANNFNDINTDSKFDVSYTVTISNIQGAAQSNYTYKTIFFDPHAGDVLVNGSMTLLGARAAALYAIGAIDGDNCNLPGTNEICVDNADVDHDGKVTLLDARLIAQCAIGVENSLCLNH